MTGSESVGSDEEREVRMLVERWVQAVQDHDLEQVVADHTADLVMFDVPPPERGNHGLEAYRGSWPPFFEWLRRGARFELDELHVDAGADRAFAWALLRCGTDADLAQDPERRLRLTLGLRRADGRWQVAHEHHSFVQR